MKRKKKKYDWKELYKKDVMKKRENTPFNTVIKNMVISFFGGLIAIIMLQGTADKNVIKIVGTITFFSFTLLLNQLDILRYINWIIKEMMKKEFEEND